MDDKKIHYKECSPIKTINYIKSILKANNLNVVEEISKKSEIDTYSCRITLKDTTIGSNGKGVNKEYALASGYAELMERYQNNLLPITPLKKINEKFHIAPDEKIISIEQLIKENNPCINKILVDGKQTHQSLAKKIKYIQNMTYFDAKYLKNDKQLVCLPFYGVKEEKPIYMPYNFLIQATGSNGMSAGNSIEEALVQGFSEIFERIVQTKIFLEKPTFPEIPESVINEYPLIKEKVQLLKNNREHFKYKFLDCSFNGLYPVVALLIYKIDSGKYGIKLGSHPDLGVALERTLTEATQCQKLSEYSEQNEFSFNLKTYGINDISNNFKIGIGDYPYSIFSNKPTYKFTKFKSVKNKTNKELVKSCIDIFNKLGKNVYIRDVSIFNFPSCHIYVPSLSEIHSSDSKTVRFINSRTEISEIISNKLNKCTNDDIEFCLAIMNYFSSDIGFSSIQIYYPYVDPKDIPFETYNYGMLYFNGLGELYLGNYQTSYDILLNLYNAIIDIAPKQDKNIIALHCLILALEGMINKIEINEIETYLKKLFIDDIANKVITMFKDKKTIFNDFPNFNNPQLLKKPFYKKVEHTFYCFTKAYINALKKKQIDQNTLKDCF